MRNNGSEFNLLGIDIKAQNKKVQEFKDSINNEKNSTDTIINKYLLHGTPYIFKDDENKFYELKNEIANFIEVSQTNIFVVGSAKLGFSIAPSKRYKYFNEDSDIDIAIIDEATFIRYWKILYEYNTIGRARSYLEEEKYRKFLEYFFKGWLRPDKFPSNMNEKKEWFDFFSSLHKKYNHKIAAGIYYDIHVFCGYNRENIKSIREVMKNE